MSVTFIFNTQPTPMFLFFDIGVLTSQGWWEAWQPSPKVTRSY